MKLGLDSMYTQDKTQNVEKKKKPTASGVENKSLSFPQREISFEGEKSGASPTASESFGLVINYSGVKDLSTLCVSNKLRGS